MSFMHFDASTVIGVAVAEDLTSTMTVGSSSYTNSWTWQGVTVHGGLGTYYGTTIVDVFGYADQGDYGSVTDDTYTDANGQLKTMSSLYYVTSSGTQGIYLTLVGADISDSDSIFTTLTIDGTSYQRTDRTSFNSYTSPERGVWYWDISSTPFGTGGDVVPFTISVT